MADPVEILPDLDSDDRDREPVGQPIQTSLPESSSNDREDADDDDMATLSQATTASAVNPARPVEQVSTSAAATPNPAKPVATSSTARAQNPATPQSSAAASSTASSASTVPAAQTTSPRATSAAATSTDVRTSTAAVPTARPSSSTTTSAARSSASSSSTSSSSRNSSSSGTASRTSSATSSATNTKAASEGKSGVGGTGLSLGALIGIIIGGIVGLVLIGLIVTRTIRKKQRRDRAKRRSSMFDWPATGLDGAEEAYEKPRYEPPSQSYAMSDSYNSNSNPGQTVSYVTNETAYAPVPAAPAASYVERNQPQYAYPPQHQQQQYQHQQQQQYPTYQENVTPPPNPAPAAAAGASASALRDGSWVRVKVGFVRSLEDELAISPGQQLYLHTAYDDGWCLCEDSNQSRGVVPLSCIEPEQGSGLSGMSRSGSAGSADGERLARRSSLHRGGN